MNECNFKLYLQKQKYMNAFTDKYDFSLDDFAENDSQIETKKPKIKSETTKRKDELINSKPNSIKPEEEPTKSGKICYLSFRLEKSVFRKLKLLSIKKRKSMNRLVLELLEEEYNRRKDEIERL